jgi:hypothetical protein
MDTIAATTNFFTIMKPSWAKIHPLLDISLD